MDKFGKYKPVVVMSLLLNAVFHHSLMMIPQQEIPGTVPSAYVMRHPQTGSVEVSVKCYIHKSYLCSSSLDIITIILRHVVKSK